MANPNIQGPRLRLSIFAAFFTLGLHTGSLYAAESELLSALNEDMAQAAKTAAENNHNIDYQPFILSVWQHDELIRFGARTLKDALQLVPGVQITADTMNNATAIMRGSNPFAYGQTKLVIDGIVMNDQTFDTYNAYLDFPIEIIERIEVVRGSGSFLQGVNGYSGTINVVTKPHNDASKPDSGSVFASLGNDRFRQTGLWNSYTLPNGKLAIDAFYQSNDASSPVIVTDSYGNSSYAPLQYRHAGAGISYRQNDFYLLGRINDYRQGSAFGSTNTLPSPESTLSMPAWNLEIGNLYRFTSDLEVSVKAGVTEDTSESDELSVLTDFQSLIKVKSRRMYANVYATYKGFENHILSLGYGIKYEKVLDSVRISTDLFDGTGTLIDYSDTYPMLDTENAQRYVHTISLSDSVNISDNLALALNADAEIASHMPFHTHTRAALVYQPHRSHILKAMISHSCRLPSWQEMYTINNSMRLGNPYLKPEHVLSYEVQYLYKPYMNSTFGLNLFYLENDNQITASTPDHIFRNLAKRDIVGFESEYRGSIGENDLITLSYTHIDGNNVKETEDTDFLPYSSSDLIKGAFSYLIAQDWNAGISARYESAKRRSPYDPRSGEIKPYSTIDFNLGWESGNGFYIQGLIKNIANHIYRYPAPAYTYADDYPVEGRTFYLRTGWNF